MAFNFKKILITGGAGFLGSFLSEEMLRMGADLTIYDRFSHGTERIKGIQNHPNLKIVRNDCLNYSELKKAVAGQELIWHLSGNTDIPAGIRDTTVDLNDGLVATRNVLEAMRETGTRRLVFASSGAIYGERTFGKRSESNGPILPISLYGAGKVAGEVFISAYSHLFGIHAWIFRFGNIISGRITHGAILDFIRKLRKNPNRLEVLGDGTQTKSYLLAEECIEGMKFVVGQTATDREEGFCDVFNLGAPDETKVIDIARMVVDEMGLKDCQIVTLGGERGWRGDQAKIALDISKVRELGWEPEHSSDEAVRISVRRMIAQEMASK